MLFNPMHGRQDLRTHNQPASQLAGAMLKQLPDGCKPGTRERVARLLESGAWIDAALALVACELPQWRMRRLIYEDGEWLCSLSRQPDLPCDLDDTVEARHETAPYAIWNAFLEARGRLEPEPPSSLPSALRIRQRRGTIVCCDNFA